MDATARGWCRPALALAALLAAGCGGSSFSAAGSGGSGGGGGAAGSDGGAGCPVCKTGEYCQASSGHCVSCGNLSQLDFGPPEPLDAVNKNPSGDLRFPRVAGPNGDALLYVADNHALPTPGRQIWLATNPDADPGIRVSADAASASGPLYVQFDYVAGTTADVLFDRVEAPGSDPKRDLCTASLSTKSLPASSGALPLPFNKVGSDDYSIAVAGQVHRAWWMSDRDTGAVRLVTLGLSPIGAPQDVSLGIQVDGQKTCPRAGADATPWTTPDGSVMLFSSVRLDGDCHPINGQERGLYSVRLDQSGRPENGAAGQPLASVDQDGVDETDPSLSPDLCTLYYAADDGGGFKLYRAPRR